MKWRLQPYAVDLRYNTHSLVVYSYIMNSTATVSQWNKGLELLTCATIGRSRRVMAAVVLGGQALQLYKRYDISPFSTFSNTLSVTTFKRL